MNDESFKKKENQMQKRNGSEKENRKDKYGVSWEGDFFACSGTDCTGLIPAGIVSDAQRESYKELYPSLTPPVISKKDGEES